MDTAVIDNVEATQLDTPDIERTTDDVNAQEQKVEAGKEEIASEEKGEAVEPESKAEEQEGLAGVKETEPVVIGDQPSEDQGVEAEKAETEVQPSATAEEASALPQAEEASEEAESSSAPEATPIVVDGPSDTDGATKEDAASTTVDGAEGTDVGDDTVSSSGIVRTATPGSRTSTPPPGTTHAAPKKFSAVNVTKKFLSKTSQPAAAPAPGSKLGLNGRTSASPVPISTPSRLVSTKLTTAPLAKSSASPNPPPPGATPTSSASPWAKPALLPDVSSSDSSSLAQPAPRRSLANLAATIGQGQGMAATKPVAWKAVAPERSRFGMSRDFPTTREIAEGESRIGREIAEGKMQAQMAAQQQAAHNQALLKSLNAFSNLDSAHRWDDDDDDDVIDFGDDVNLLSAPPALPPAAAPKPTYVPADDFDRSWPRKAPVEVSTRRTDEPRDRVLFNASSNRLEPSLPRQNAPPAPTRLMSRNGAEVPARPPVVDRALPPHQQAGPAGSRALPPHMANAPEASRVPPAAPSTSGRPGWGAPRDNVRPTQPGGYADQVRPTPVSPVKLTSALPSRPTWEQQSNATSTAQPVPPRATAQLPIQPTAVPVAPAAPALPNVDEQTAEMHTAAERARLRREAEEAERTAAMERARKKAKELEERLGLKPAAPPAAAPPAQVAPPPAPVVPTQPSLLRRPVPAPAPAPVASPQPPPGLPAAPAVVAAPAPRAEPSRPVESSWRRAVPAASEPPKPAVAPPAIAEKPAQAIQPRVESILQAHAGAEQSLREAIAAAPVRDLPPHVAAPPTVPAAIAAALETVVRLPGQSILPESEQPAGRKESGFDSMLARIQAAMAEARLAPPITEVITSAQPPATAPSQPAQAAPAAPSAPPPPPRPIEIFDVTQPPPPRSPPPAWRTYSVRLPSSLTPESPISPSRLKAADTPLSHPQGWLLVFTPPLDLPPRCILADHLLPRPIYPARFGRPGDSAPIVSISPRRLEPFERKKKKTQVQATKSVQSEVMQPHSTAESLIAPISGYAWQQQAEERPVAGPSTWTAPPASAAEPVAESAEQAEVPSLGVAGDIKKPKSPVKSSPAAKAEKEGQFAQEAVSVGPIARSRPADVKTGVRFMVSSELEGDSLLDEVNKMSLETVGEGWGGEDKDDKSSLPKTPGSETPKTPPSLNSGQPTSPNGGTPWTRSTPRGANQHDHLKSVWDQAGSTDNSTRTAPTPTDLPLPPPLISIPSTQSAQSDVSTPMYPSLNAPSSSEIIPSQPLPANKLGYPAPSAFSPGPGNGFMRPPASPHGYMYHTPSPDSDAYGSIAGRPNGGFSAPWSPAAFGASMTSPGYGYAGKHPQQPTSAEQKDVNPYGFSQAAFSQQQGYGQAYAQQQQQHMGANAYARGVGAGTYAYGYAGQAASGARAAGRFGPHAHAQAVNGEYQQAYGDAGFYGGIGQQQQHGRQAQHIGQVHSPVYGQTAHPHAQHQHQQQQAGQGQGYAPGGGAGAVGQQIMRGGRKMW